MKIKGSVKTYEPIANLSAMPTMVRCTTELPDPTTLPEGSVFRLVDTQAGYTAMHYYVQKEGEWVDITFDDNIFPDPEGSVILMRSGTHYLLHISNMLNAVDRIEVDVFDRDVLVCKKGSVPENIDDGTTLFSSIAEDGVMGYPIPYDRIGSDPDSYCYRLFHVFKTGFMTYQDAVITD